MNNYMINGNTLAILPTDKRYAMVIESGDEFVVKRKPTTIISKNCLLYGSSIEGRFKSTEFSTGITYKPPIVLKETSNTIYFPTASPRLNRCGWINLRSIKKVFKDNKRKGSIIEFNNNKKVYLDTSINIINNQILKASRLECILRQNKSKNS